MWENNSQNHLHSDEANRRGYGCTGEEMFSIFESSRKGKSGIIGWRRAKGPSLRHVW